jgi:hypothetical protein
VVVGAEWADRVSPHADLRVLGQEENRCWICESADTACTHSTYTSQLPKAPHVPTERIVMARATAQSARTAAKTPRREAEPGVSPTQAVAVPEPAPQVPAEGAQVPVTSASDVPPPKTTETVLDGDGFEQQIQLSPITPDTGAQTTASDPTQFVIPAGDPTEYRDVLTEPVPEGKINAATDPQRPRRDGLQGVLVSRNDQWPQTGAWMTDPTNARRVIFTRDIHRAEYAYHTKTPAYMLVGRRGTRMPRPRTA